MPFITKVVATRIYRNYQYEVPEEFITKHFGSEEAFMAAFSGDNGELSHDAAGDDFSRNYKTWTMISLSRRATTTNSLSIFAVRSRNMIGGSRGTVRI